MNLVKASLSGEVTLRALTKEREGTTGMSRGKTIWTEGSLI